MSQHVLIQCDSDDASPLSFHILNYVLMLRDAEILHMKAAVDWRRGSTIGMYADEEAAIKHGPNVWEWYFKQPMASIEEVEAHPHDVWPQVFPIPAGDNGEISELLKLLTLGNVQTTAGIQKMRQVIPKFLLWHGFIQKRAEDLFQKYGLNPAETIAVAHRSTNKFNDLRLHPELVLYPIESYYETIDDLLVENPNRKIWIRPEEQVVAEKFLQRYPSAITMAEDFYLIAPHEEINMHIMADTINPKPGYEIGLDVVTMMVMFSMCGAFVKNVSNLTDVAASLSSGKVILINEVHERVNQWVEV